MVHHRHEPSDATIRALNQASLLRLGLFLSIALLVGSTAPQGMLLAVVSPMLWVGAIVSALVAAFLSENAMQAPHLTRWDESAVLMLVSLGLGFFIDHQAVIEQVETLRGPS
ncbi:hypothetical protein [Roseospira visakhapatnamensis]|uniref:ABC-type transport system involved in multi-copper enzyme maturation permease subunit n=1 Tax=Roseospira visakhapatnamensis TaxID=390880 RepID=A0A7W6RAY0_9PROT|nr:hypothetical protein [Roseospira visakhapatnamensis]MBB4265132.1 ABC-type transport system involved in multi-copper enzyme maturation permease subunit [Roseospira visakhapatnamensis]